MLIGAALASWLAWRGPARSAAGRVVVEVLGLVGLLGAGGRLGAGSTARPSGSTAAGCSSAALSVAAVIAAVAHPRPGPLAAVLALRPLRWLGHDQLRPLPVALAGLHRARRAAGRARAAGRCSPCAWPSAWPSPWCPTTRSSGRSAKRPDAGGGPHVRARPAVRRTAGAAAGRAGRRRPASLGHRRPAVAATLVVALLLATSGATTPAPLADTVTEVRASLDDVLPPPASPAIDDPPRILFAGDSVSYFLAQQFAGPPARLRGRGGQRGAARLPIHPGSHPPGRRQGGRGHPVADVRHALDRGRRAGPPRRGLPHRRRSRRSRS